MKYVYIKDLKQPYREMALIEQEAQGNKRNKNLRLYKYNHQENFSWEDSILGYSFWANVYNEDYPEITPEIKSKFPSVFKKDTVEEIIKILNKYSYKVFGGYGFNNENYKKSAEEIAEKFINLKTK